MKEVIELKKLNEVYYLVDSFSGGVLEELRDYFRFRPPGYKYMPPYRNGFWDGYINIFDPNTRLFYVGLKDYMIIFAKEHNYDVEFIGDDPTEEISDEEISKFLDNEKLYLEPRYYQIEALEMALRQKRITMICPTGSGKSYIMYMIMRWYRLSTLIIVPTTTLVHQLYSDFEEYGFNSEKYVHKLLGGADKNSDKPVVISTWQSAYKLDKSWFSKFDVVMGDECHLFKAKSLTGIMTKLVDCKHRIGLSGSLDGSTCNQLILEGLFGKLFKIVTTKKLMDDKILASLKIKLIVMGYKEEERKSRDKNEYQDEIKYLISHPRRNNYIKNLTLSLKGNTLVLFQFVDDHGQILYDMINSSVKENRKCFFIHGKVSGEERNDIRAVVEEENDAIIIASYGTFSTGINIKNLNNIIFASPSKSRIRNIQSIGRSLRMTETKVSASIYDIADDLSYDKGKKPWYNYGLRHMQERLKIYNSEEFNVKIYGVDI